jgi:hypothetical protein
MRQTERRRDKAEMYPLIEQWQSSGLSKQAFCERQEIAKSVFYYWHKRYKADLSPGGFLPIKIGQIKSTPANSFIEVGYPNGVVLRLPEHTPPAVIKSYLHL